VLGSLWLVVGAAARADDAGQLEQLKSQVSELRDRLSETEGKVEDVAAERKRIDLMVELLERERELVGAELARSRSEAASIDAELGRLEAAREEAVRRLGDKLAVLYRLGTGGAVRLLLAPEGKDRLEAARIVAFLARREQRWVDELGRRTEALERRRADRVRVGEKVAELERGLGVKEGELREARQRQDRVMRTLERQKASDAKKLAELESRAARLERVLELLEKSNRPTTLRTEDPHRYKGALAWPLEGSITTRFGKRRNPKFAVYVMNNGIEIAAPAGREVDAVYPGRVRFARWLQGYGNLVIVDHGSRFLTLYGHLAGIAVQDGEEVTMGERVGVVAETSDESEEPTLYFEIRDEGQAVDPTIWLRLRSEAEEK